MKTPVLRSAWDRLRQVTFFELGGLLLFTFPLVWFSGQSTMHSAVLLAVLALIAAIWNGLYNTVFDWIEARQTGRTADQRPVKFRILQALGFEGGLMLLTLPVIAAWLKLSWLDAFITDISLSILYVIYAFFFNLLYDRLFPIAQHHPE